MFRQTIQRIAPANQTRERRSRHECAILRHGNNVKMLRLRAPRARRHSAMPPYTNNRPGSPAISANLDNIVVIPA
jgi:hypothetical protein